MIIKNCYNAADILIEYTKEVNTPRLGSLTCWAFNDTDLSQNNFCYVNGNLKSVGDYKGDNLQKYGIVEFTNVEEMKDIAPKLGPNFKADTNNKNEGFPILVWQEK